MKTFIAALAILVLVGLSVSAQSGPQPGGASNAAQGAAQTGNGVFTAVQKLVGTMSKNIVAGAEEMPPDKYDFRPTPAQNTFGHLIVHMITANDFFCSAMSGAQMPAMPVAKDDDPKDALVAKLKASFDLCTSAVAKLDDAKIEDAVSTGRGSTPLGSLIVTFVQDYGDHYAQESGYLRAAGLLPPTAAPRPAQSGSR